MIDLLVQSLALARLLRLFTEDDGPYMILGKFRRLIGIDDVTGAASNELGGLFSCYLCLGIWLAPVVMLLYAYANWVVWCLAIAQGASLVYALFNKLEY